MIFTSSPHSSSTYVYIAYVRCAQRLDHVAFGQSDPQHRQTCYLYLPLSLHVLLGRNFVQHEPGRRPPDISSHNGRHSCATSVVASLESEARKERSEAVASRETRETHTS